MKTDNERKGITKGLLESIANVTTKKQAINEGRDLTADQKKMLMFIVPRGAKGKIEGGQYVDGGPDSPGFHASLRTKYWYYTLEWNGDNFVFDVYLNIAEMSAEEAIRMSWARSEITHIKSAFDTWRKKFLKDLEQG